LAELNYNYQQSNATSMSITLKPEHEEFIQTQITTGQFSHPDEVIEAAFRLLEKLNVDYAQWVGDVRDRVTIAKAEVDRGEALDGETVVNAILDRFRQAKENQS
jgi:antitoxin ParD1/3/4